MISPYHAGRPCTYGGRGRGCGSAILKSQYITILFCCSVALFVFVLFAGVDNAKRTHFIAFATRTIHFERTSKFSGNILFLYRRLLTSYCETARRTIAARRMARVSILTRVDVDGEDYVFFCLLYCYRVRN